MPTIVVPYRGRGGKRRLAPLDDRAREAVAAAMLADVVAAATAVGRTLVVAGELPRALDVPVELVADPGRGLGAAVAAALAHVTDGPVLVVNADLPCVTPRDLLTLLGELPEGGLAVADAADGTTNALALPSPSPFA